MTVIDLTPSFTANLLLSKKSPNAPLWDDSSGANVLTRMNTFSNWWFDDTASPNKPDAFYSINDTNADGIIRSYTQYGQNVALFASAKAVKMLHTISNEVVNPDNSVTFDLAIRLYGASHATQYAGNGVSVVTTIKIGTTTAFTRTGNTKDSFSFDTNSGNAYTFTGLKLAPQQSYTGAQISITSTFPNGEYTNNTINLGVIAHNPLYALYVPMKTRKANAWKNLNGNNGKILKRVKGVWTDLSIENQGTENQQNKGHNRRRTGGKFLQLPKL